MSEQPTANQVNENETPKVKAKQLYAFGLELDDDTAALLKAFSFE